MPANHDPQTAELVPVTQADRDAAAAITASGAAGLGNGNKVVARGIKGGLHDSYFIVQTFARHRLSHTPDPATEPTHAKEQAAGVGRLTAEAIARASDPLWWNWFDKHGDLSIRADRNHHANELQRGERILAAVKAALALAAPASSVGEGMKPWGGGDSAPADWDGGIVLLADGTYWQEDPEDGPIYWGRDYSETGCIEPGSVIAYTPKTPDRTPEHGELASLVEALAKCNAALKELLATVEGECPSLLNEDSGGSARLDMEIEDALLVSDVLLGRCPSCRGMRTWVPADKCREPLRHEEQADWSDKAKADHRALQKLSASSGGEK